MAGEQEAPLTNGYELRCQRCPYMKDEHVSAVNTVSGEPELWCPNPSKFTPYPADYDPLRSVRNAYGCVGDSSDW